MKKNIYPTVKSEKYSVDVTAPSSGLGNRTFINRFEVIAKQLKSQGLSIITKGTAHFWDKMYFKSVSAPNLFYFFVKFKHCNESPSGRLKLNLI